MKVSKTLLQAMAVAVAVSTVSSSCAKLKVLSPKAEKTAKKEPYNCPGCGMG